MASRRSCSQPHQAGIKNVIIPDANEANLEDVPEAILNDLDVTTVKDFQQVLDVMMEGGSSAGAEFVPTSEKGNGDRPSAPA